MSDARQSSCSRAILPIVAMPLLLGCGPSMEHDRPQVQGGDPERGRSAIAHYECGVCHVIPGIAHATGRTGPSLASYARFPYLAGKFPQQPDLLVRWIVDAPSLSPQTAMPAMAMSEQQARDIAAYLYGLD